MSTEALILINEESILKQLKEERGQLVATTKKGNTLDVRAIIDGEAYVSAPNSEGVFKLSPEQLPRDSFVAQAALKELPKTLVKQASVLSYHNGNYYQCTINEKGRHYRVLSGKINIVG